MESGYWESLPNEIMEKILIFVPTFQLPFNDAWVCKKWTKIILQPQFWVHKLKKHGLSIENEIWTVLQEFKNTGMVSCLYYASLYLEHLTLKTTCLSYESLFQEYSFSTPTTDEYTNNWCITDSLDTMLMASGVLVCRSQSFAYLHLKKNQKIKALPMLLKLLTARKVPLSVTDDYAFWNFSPRINYLQILKGNNDEAKQLTDFRGCLPTLEGLPSSIDELYLSIGVDDQNVAIDPDLSRLKQISSLNLHLKAGTDISDLTKVSSDYMNFIVSGLEESHIFWMLEVTKKFLTNEEGELVLIFFNYQLDLKSSENLLNSMSEAGFWLETEILCSSSKLSRESGTKLYHLAFDLWPNCASGFQCFKGDGFLIPYLWDAYGIFEPYNDKESDAYFPKRFSPPVDFNHF